MAEFLGISEQTIHVMRRLHLTDTGRMPGVRTHGQAELAAARNRIAELEVEPARCCMSRSPAITSGESGRPPAPTASVACTPNSPSGQASTAVTARWNC
ncbi:hypothetical protein [Streptomyces sp. URMC 129]|uniref:hypothetical protein n=1 Tax=Streptomyces sp. URMC 129 TaxID=3423407 RepID=UPI003F1B761D